MSMRPGVTYSPATSTVFVACDAGMFAATAAIFLSLIATSRTALILLRPSMTRPPFRSRSYGACACATGVKVNATSHTAARFMIAPVRWKVRILARGGEDVGQPFRAAGRARPEGLQRG